MPSFMGHVIPGTMIGGLSVWYLWVTLHRYFKSRLDKIHQPRYDLHDQQECRNGRIQSTTPDAGKGVVSSSNNNNKGGNVFAPNHQHQQQHYEYESSILVTCSGLGRFPLMSSVALPLTSVGILVESYAVFREGLSDLANNGQHMTMYFFFGLVGFFEFLTTRGVPIPPGTDYALMTLALVVEGFLFASHLGGRSMVDVQIHTYLVYLLVASCIALAIEMRHQRNPLAAIVRSILGIVHGTWFHTAAWILYPPYIYPVTKDIHHGDELASLAKMDQEAMHMEMKLVTLYLAMNIAGAIALTTLLGWIASKRVNQLGQKAPTYEFNLEMVAAGKQNHSAQHIAYAPLLESEVNEDFATSGAGDDDEMSLKIGRI